VLFQESSLIDELKVNVATDTPLRWSKFNQSFIYDLADG